MEDLHGNICMLKTILETCDEKMTADTKKRVQTLLDTFTKKLEELKNQEMQVEYYYSVSEESDEEEEEKSDDEDCSERDESNDSEEEDSDDEHAFHDQLVRQWEDECRKQEQEGDVGYPEFDLADEV